MSHPHSWKAPLLIIWSYEGLYREVEDSRDLERPPFSRRMQKVLEDFGEVHTCVEEHGRKEIILGSSRDLL